MAPRPSTLGSKGSAGGSLWQWSKLGLPLTVAVLTTAIAVICVALLAQQFGADRAGVEWVSAIGQWISGAATLATVWVAWHQILEGKRERQLSQLRDQILEGTKVFFWVSSIREGSTNRWSITIRNLTSTEFFRWQLILQIPSADAEVLQVSNGVAPLPPGETSLLFDVRPSRSIRSIMLCFEDARGNWWSRTAAGQLEPLATVQLGEVDVQSHESVEYRKSILDATP